MGRNFGKIPAVQGLFAGILPKRSPRSAGLIPGLCKWKSQYPRYFPAPRGPWLQMTGALLDSQSFEFEICILQALNMPLICCTNIFFQGRLSRHITSPSEKTRPESWPGDHMGKATPVRQLSLSHRCHQM